MTVRQMCDIDVQDARGCDLFIFGQTKDPRGQHMLSSVGLSISTRWEVQQSDASGAKAGSVLAPGASVVGVENLTVRLSKWIDTCGIDEPSIAIDISCMSRPVMAAAFQAVLQAAQTRVVRLNVLYVLAEYTPPPQDLPPNEDICPINDWFGGWPTNATASTSLIVGIGYERDKASGACEYFDASETWVFVPQSAISEYEAAVINNNEGLLASARRREHMTHYRVEHPTETFGLLAGAVSRVATRMNPVLLPFGPKIFFALSLLVATVYREVGVWHVTGDSDLPDIAQAPSALTPAFRVELGPALQRQGSESGLASAASTIPPSAPVQ